MTLAHLIAGLRQRWDLVDMMKSGHDARTAECVYVALDLRFPSSTSCFVDVWTDPALTDPWNLDQSYLVVKEANPVELLQALLSLGFGPVVYDKEQA